MTMAGGSGTRLWPMSRRARPKQLLPLGPCGRSLLAIAHERLAALVPAERRWICAAESFRAPVREALPGFDPARFLGEPAARDTLAAVGFAATAIHAADPDAVFAVLTSDHLIEGQPELERAFDLAFRLVEADPSRLVTFAIEPTFAATGFGWVERGDAVAGFPGAFLARRFVEKPERARAEEFLRAGTFGWNSGMFVFSARTVLDALARHEPAMAAGLAEIAAAWSTPGRAATLARVYPALRRISVDRGLLEPAAADARLRICSVPMALQWRDVGSWPSYGETLAPDADGNRTNGAAMHLGSRGVLAVSDDPAHLIATIGPEDVVVVHTRDATLVVRADLAEQVKQLAERVPEALQ